ncbi:MAG TPA: RDD family protein [Gemmatimonadaceae bacterium]|jgi:uncharacterized RDD family membrane protein YckC|nr:RDD family protein [Gemmatimonadaceae bacterium]
MIGGPATADTPTSDGIAFGSFALRLRALVVDSVVLACALVAIVMFISVADAVPGAGRVGVIVMAALLILYEPFLVARRGATVGHRRANLRVVYDRTGEHPGFVRAFVRYVLKTIFGAPSFLLMALTRRHQALHDRLTGTTVRIDDPGLAHEADIAWERPAGELEPIGAASRARRVLVILAYLVLVFVVFNVLTWALVSGACILESRCTPGDDRIQGVLGLAWIVGSAWCLIAGWRGRLWGCRPRKSMLARDSSGA